MNIGGVAAVLPSTSVAVEETSKAVQSTMTCEDERMSARWKERRARFLGCIENTKLIAERTKVRQENARRERLKKERAEMEKYRRRYLETAMKQYMEQQAKTREVATSIPHSHAHQHSQLLPPTQGYPNFMQTSCVASPLMSSHPSVPACRPNGRKRPFENSAVGWSPYTQMAAMCDPRNMYPRKEAPVFPNNLPPLQSTNAAVTYPNMMPMPYCPTRSNDSSNGPDLNNLDQATNKQGGMPHANGIVPEVGRAQHYDQTRLGIPMIPTTSQAQVETSAAAPATCIPEEINNLSTMPELAESHMRNLMDQFGPGNPLDDLGGNCLEGILASRFDEQPSTGTVETDGFNAMQSASNSVVSPMSASSRTPNSNSSPANISASARCSTNSYCESHSAAVTPQQSIATPCDQQQQIAMNPSTLSVAAGSMVQQHPLLCASTGSSSTSSSSCGTVPSASAVAGEHNGSGSCVYSGMTPMSGPVQQVPYMPPQHHLQQQQHQHQQLNSFSSGCQMSANSAAFPHLDSARLYNANEYARFGQCYMYDDCNNKSSIFPRFPPQSLIRYPTPQQYGAYPATMKCPHNNGMAYYPQPQMTMQQQAYQLPSFESTYHHHHECEPAFGQNSVYPVNHF